MEFKRLQLSLLFIFNFFGILVYLLNLEILPMQLTRGTLLSGIIIAFLTLVPGFIPLVIETKIGKILTTSIGILMTTIVLLLGIIYTIDGEIIIGVIICLLACGGLTGSILSVKWTRQK